MGRLSLMSKRRLDHDLYRGTLDIAVLVLLVESPDHGYGLIERLRQRSAGVLDISEGAIYPLLHRLESKGVVSFTWETTAQNRRAKKYFVTESGLSALRERCDQWKLLSDAMGRIVNPFRPQPGPGIA